MLLLSFERGASGVGQYTEFRRQYDEIVARGPALRPRSDDPVARQKLANCLVELECLRYHAMHILTQVEQGRDLGSESSMTKLQWSETFQDLWEAFDDVLGPEASPRPARAPTSTSRRSSTRPCGRGRSPSGAARPRSSATSSPSACSASPAEELAACSSRSPTTSRRSPTTVREFLADRFDLDAVRGVVEDPDGDGHPRQLWKGLADQGALAVLVPEEHDGLGLGLLDAQVVARELGRGVAPGPWTATVLAAEAVRLAGSPEQQAALAAGASPRATPSAPSPCAARPGRGTAGASPSTPPGGDGSPARRRRSTTRRSPA